MEVKGFKFKYYKYRDGNEENPYIGKDGTAALWWDGEKTFHRAITEKDGDEFIANLETTYDEALRNGGLSGPLTDTARPKSERLMIFYLDLWHGKWFPDDDLDLIFKY